MSYYNKDGYRIEETYRWSPKRKDFYRVFQINFEGLETKIGGNPDWKTREEAEKHAQQMIENNLLEEGEASE